MRYQWIAGWLLLMVVLPMILFSEEEEKPKEPIDILKKSVKTWYDLETEGVARYACFIECWDAIKFLDLRTKVMCEEVDYELIWEADKPIKVKPRNIPDYFGREAKEDTQTYAQFMETTLKEFFRVTSPVKEISKILDKLEGFEISAEDDKEETRIKLNRKKTPPDTKRRRPRQADKDEGIGNISIWINKDYQMTKMEMTHNKEKITALIKSIKYGKLWNISQLDVTTYDDDDNFKERVQIQFTYTYPKKVMLPSKLKITALDKDGKVRERRNEPNPITVNLEKYEVEVNK